MTTIETLRFWCQKVLPLVYDDSLSYYELLCKVVAKANELVENNNELNSGVGTLENLYENLNDKVEGLINNLVDVVSPWDSSIAYHIFSIVEYQGANYIAIQDVPIGTMITNTEYWQPANTALEQINAIGVTVNEIKDDLYYVTPEMYGAVGDGVNDDSDAIEDALEDGNVVIGALDKTYYISRTLNVSHDVQVRNMNFIIEPAEPDGWENFALYCTNADLIVVENCTFKSTATKVPRINYSNNNLTGLASNTGACHITSGTLIMRDCELDTTSCVYAITGASVYLFNIIGKNVEMGVYCDGEGTYYKLEDVDFEMSANMASGYYHFLYARDHGKGEIINCKCTLSDNVLISESSVQWGNQIHIYHTNSAYQGNDEAEETLIMNTIIDLRNNYGGVALGQYSTGKATFIDCELYISTTGNPNFSLTTGVRAPWFFNCKIVQTHESGRLIGAGGTIPTGYEGEYLLGRMTNCDIELNNPSAGATNLLTTTLNQVLIEKCNIKTTGYIFYGTDTSFAVRDCTLIFNNIVRLNLGSTRAMSFIDCTIIAQGDIDGTVTTGSFTYAKLLNCIVVGLAKSKAGTGVVGTATFLSNNNQTIEVLNTVD